MPSPGWLRASFLTLYVLTTECIVVSGLHIPIAPFGLRRYHEPTRAHSHSLTSNRLCGHPSGFVWPSSKNGNGNTTSDMDMDMDRDRDDLVFDDGDLDDEYSQVFDFVLKVYCTHSEPDYSIPWQKMRQTTSTSSGFVTDIPGIGLRIITNAHAVEYGISIQVQRRGDDQKYEAVVEAIGNECDLALLRVESPQFWAELESASAEKQDNSDDNRDDTLEEKTSPPPRGLTFGLLPALQQEVEVLGYPQGGDSMSVTAGVVSRIEMSQYVQAGMHLLAMQIDAAINPGNSGGPVVNKYLEVVGVAFQTLTNAENIGYVVPVTVVHHFLEDIKRHGTYTGFCSLGVHVSYLDNEAFRKSLGMMATTTTTTTTHQMDKDNSKNGSRTSDLSGVMIRNIQPTAAAAMNETLRISDVIMAVDGIPVANDGKIPFRRGERVALACYTQTRFIGESVEVSLLRAGKKIELNVPVGISHNPVPAHWNNQPPPYLIVAGLVFTALSVPYLGASDAWEDYVSDEMSYLLLQTNKALERRSDQVVVLTQVLAHRMNLGYDGLEDLHLIKFNGQNVRSLEHLERLIYFNGEDEATSSSISNFLRFEFAPGGEIIVMDRSDLEQATQEVCQEHAIRKQYVLHEHERKNKETTAVNGEMANK